MKFVLFFMGALVAVAPARAQNSESLGRLFVEDVFLEPGYRTVEPRTGGFSLNRSLVGIRWDLDPFISARIAFGTRSLLNPVATAVPTWTAQEKNQLGMVESYVQWQGGYGQFRGGMIPIRYGLESGQPEWERPPFYPMFRGRRYVPRRDVGASYEVSAGSFTSYVAGHNGESDDNQDDRMWLTGRWSVNGDWKSEIGVSATVARFIPQGSTQEQRFRMSNFFAGFNVYGLSLGVEANLGAYLRDSDLIRQLYSWRVDLTHPLAGPVGLLAQYEFLEPDHGVVADQVRQAAFGFSVRNKTRTSSLYVIGTKVFEEANEIPNDVLEVVWQVTPWTN